MYNDDNKCSSKHFVEQSDQGHLWLPGIISQLEIHHIFIANILDEHLGLLQ